MIDFSQVTDLMVGSTPVEQVTDSQGNVLWSAYVDPSTVYFYVQDASRQANTLSIKKNNTSAPSVEVFKSTDQVNWESMGSTNTAAITATVPANSKLYLKATIDRWGNSGSAYNFIKCDGNFNVGGNIMSLLYGDDFEDKISFSYGASGDHVLGYLFYNNDTLISADKLSLPATTLASYCYASMFRNCPSLTKAPELPATSMEYYCYTNMFSGCTSLTQAPELPATSLYNNCYYYMFSGCTSLTQAPELPATTLSSDCYSGMFTGCTSLTTAPALPAKSMIKYCYSDMFSGCTSLTQAPELPATRLAENCYSNMFKGCTSLTQAPALPAVNVFANSYANMFQGCTALSTAPQLLVKNLQNYCYYEMFKGCTSLNSVTSYAANISASGCLTNWLSGVSLTGDFYNLGGATYPSGASGIPSGWTVHTSL